MIGKFWPRELFHWSFKLLIYRAVSHLTRKAILWLSSALDLRLAREDPYMLWLAVIDVNVVSFNLPLYT